MDKEWTLRELAAETGVPERTIRFYISRGLLAPPLRGGRGAAYGPSHKERLEKIRQLQAKGLMLAEIAFALSEAQGGAGETQAEAEKTVKADHVLLEEAPLLARASVRTDMRGPAPDLPSPGVWRTYSIADDVIVMLRAEAAPWRAKRVLSALRHFSAEINDETGCRKKEGDDE
jgi:DNA-binding transcriptional MerR regulator